MTSENDSLGAWLDALAAKTPAPSGGGAAALALAVAGALAAMVARFSPFQLTDAEALANRADLLRRQAFDLAGRDEEAWTQVMAVSRFRSAGVVLDSPEPPEAPGSGGHEHGTEFVRATEVPLQVMAVASEVIAMMRRLATEGNPRLRGDALTGAHLARASATAAAVLVRLNLPSVPESERRRLSDQLALYEGSLAELVDGDWFAPTGGGS